MRAVEVVTQEGSETSPGQGGSQGKGQAARSLQAETHRQQRSRRCHPQPAGQAIEAIESNLIALGDAHQQITVAARLSPSG